MDQHSPSGPWETVLPEDRQLRCGGAWHGPVEGTARPRRRRPLPPRHPDRPRDDKGALVSQAKHKRAMGCIRSARDEGATLVCRGNTPADPGLDGGFFMEPTVFSDVRPDMRIAREEIFCPDLSVLRWTKETEMLHQVSAVEDGLTCSNWKRDIARAHRTAMTLEAGFVWSNKIAKQFPGVSFGGVKQSGKGREESLDEPLAFAQEKGIHISLVRP